MSEDAQGSQESQGSGGPKLRNYARGRWMADDGTHIVYVDQIRAWAGLQRVDYWPAGQWALRSDGMLMLGADTDVDLLLFYVNLTQWDRDFLKALQIGYAPNTEKQARNGQKDTQ